MQSNCQLLSAFFKDHESKAFELSCEERDQKGLLEEKNLVYGEITFPDFYRLLEQVNPHDAEVFMDLGSGLGKAVFAAAMQYPHLKCVGLELLEGLYELSQGLVASYKKELCPGAKLEFRLGDYFKQDISDADIVFVAATTYPPSLVKALTNKLLELKRGARIIVLTHNLNNPGFALIGRGNYQMGWNCEGSKTQVNLFKRV